MEIQLTRKMAQMVPPLKQILYLYATTLSKIRYPYIVLLV